MYLEFIATHMQHCNFNYYSFLTMLTWYIITPGDYSCEMGSYDEWRQSATASAGVMNHPYLLVSTSLPKAIWSVKLLIIIDLIQLILHSFRTWNVFLLFYWMLPNHCVCLLYWILTKFLGVLQSFFSLHIHPTSIVVYN